MSLPTFEFANSDVPTRLLQRIADRVRAERKRRKLTQVEFAQLCGIPLRTFKRFESGSSDSLMALLRIIQYLQRAPGLEMLFPAETLPPRGLQAALQSIRSKLDNRVVVGEAILDQYDSAGMAAKSGKKLG